MKALRTSVLLVLLLTVAACAATTGYGKEPEQLGPDTYSSPGLAVPGRNWWPGRFMPAAVAPGVRSWPVTLLRCLKGSSTPSS